MNITDGEPGFLRALNKKMQDQNPKSTDIWGFLDLVIEVAKHSDINREGRHIDLAHAVEINIGLQTLVDRARSQKGKKLRQFDYTLTKGFMREVEFIFAETSVRYARQSNPTAYCPRIILEVICERIEGTLQFPLKIVKDAGPKKQAQKPLRTSPSKLATATMKPW